MREIVKVTAVILEKDERILIDQKLQISFDRQMGVP